MKTKQITLLLSLVLMTIIGKAQQDIQSSLYMFTPGVFNPAYAGSRDALSGVIDYRKQWLGWNGAPSTGVFNLHSPLKNDAISLGITAVNDRIGVFNNTSVFADIAYRMQLNRKQDKLSFGLRFGGDNRSANYSSIAANDANDVMIQGGSYSNFLINMGAGAYYHGKRHYVGISVPRLLTNKLTNTSNFNAEQTRHFYLMGGYVFKLNSILDLKPSAQIKYTQNAPVSVDVNLSLLYNNRFWVGMMYRHNAAIGLNAMFQITEFLQVGYAYDYTTTSMGAYSPSSHEVMLGFDLKGDRHSFSTPRFF